MIGLLLFASFVLLCLNGRARRDRIDLGFDFSMHYTYGGVPEPQLFIQFATLAGSAFMLGQNDPTTAMTLAFLSLLAGVTSLGMYLVFGPDRREWYEYGLGRFVLGGAGYLILAALFLLSWIPVVLWEFRKLGDSDQPEPIGETLKPIFWATVLPPFQAMLMLVAVFSFPFRDHMQCTID